MKTSQKAGLSEKNQELIGDLIILTWQAFLGLVTAVIIAKFAVMGGKMINSQEQILRNVEQLNHGDN